MNNITDAASKFSGGQQGGQAGSGGGAAGGQDYLDKGLNNAEQRVGGQYYDEEKMKGTNKKVTDKVKDLFQEKTGHKLPGTH
ncbi:hypothetical protein BDV18DRAFT_129802 [Aspergillus unguis]